MLHNGFVIIALSRRLPPADASSLLSTS